MTKAQSENEIERLNQEAWEQSRLNPRESLEKAQMALSLSESVGFIKGKAMALKNAAQCKWLLADYVEAMDLSLEAVSLFEEAQDRSNLSDIYNILGAIYAGLDERNNALKYYELCLELKKEIGDIQGEARALNSIGDHYMQLGQYDRAISYFEVCEKLEHGNEIMEGIVFYNLGEANFRKDNDEIALVYLQKGMEMGRKLNFPLMICYNSWLKGEIALKRFNFKEALNWLNDSLGIAKDVGVKDKEYHIYLALSRCYKGMGNFELSLDYFEKYHVLKERLIGEESAEKLKQLQIHYRTLMMQKETDIIKAKNAQLQQANIEIELQKSIIESKNRSITDSINYAHRIQSATLPSAAEIKSEFKDYFCVYRPKDIVSGDFYWFAKSKKHTIVAVGDCTGHGVPGAMLSMLGKNILDQLVDNDEVNTPAEALTYLDNKIASVLNSDRTEIRDGMDIAICVFDFERKVMHFAGAKRPILMVRDGELIEFKGTRKAIGDDRRVSFPFENNSIQIKPNDLFVLFTDGLPDQFNKDNRRKFKVSRFKDLVLKFNEQSLDVIGNKLEREFLAWKGKVVQIDDVTVLGVRV